MVKILASNIVTIIQNPYGNYAITKSLEVIIYLIKLSIDLGFSKLMHSYPPKD